MSMIWEHFMNLKGKSLVSIQAKHLVTEKYNNEFRLSSTKPFIHWRDSETGDEGFWKLKWSENEAGDDILLLSEQNTPEPLDYEYCKGSIYSKIVIKESCFMCNRASINAISGYGYSNGDEKYLYSIIIELENWFLHIESYPAIIITIHDEPPQPHSSDRLLFTTAKN
jgi:hypothetical protein